jgi:hypothetical protein
MSQPFGILAQLLLKEQQLLQQNNRTYYRILYSDKLMGTNQV